MIALRTSTSVVRPPASERTRVLHSYLITVVFLLASTLGWASASNPSANHTWEMRVCAMANNPPASSIASGGYENDIAVILADELGADVVFTWLPLNRSGIEYILHIGDCDLIIGIGESIGGVLSSVPFLRVPYVFASRADRGIEILSLDDASLPSLTIATYPAGIPTIALGNRNIVESIREYSPAITPQGLDRDGPIIAAVVSGEVDIAILFAAGAALYESANPGILRITPVTPELDFGATILPLYRTWTIGVRPHDESLRNQINLALAARWDEIVSVIDSYHVPQLAVSRPPLPSGLAEQVIRVGVIAPSQTREAHAMDLVGEAARRGAILADNTIARSATSSDVKFEIVFASAPNLQATLRAADRLILLDGVQAIVGGFDDETAAALSLKAQVHGIAFFNTGSQSLALRNELCSPNTFHVEASVDMYLDTILASRIVPNDADWFFLIERDRFGADAADRFQRSLERFAYLGEVKGVIAIEPRQFAYFDVLREIQASNASVVITLLDTESTDQFLVQYEMFGLTAELLLLPTQMAQTRELMVRYRQSAPRWGTNPRPALWETTLSNHGGGDLNERYSSRNASPMEAASWATYAAIMSVFEAVSSGISIDVTSLRAFLTDPRTELPLGKGPGSSYKAWNNQLRQPMYMVEVNMDAPWGTAVSRRIGLAQLVSEVPASDPIIGLSTSLDTIGDNADTTECTF